MKVKRNVLIIFSLVLVLGLFGTVITGCEKKPMEPKEDVVIVIGTTDKVSDLDPCQAYDFYTWEIFQNISEGLLTYEPGTTDLVPGLAAEWPTVSEDGKYTFKIKSNLDKLIAGTISKLVTEWVAETKAKLDVELNNLLRAKLEEYQESYKGFISLEEDLKGNLLEVKTYTDLAEKKKQELQKKIDEKKAEAKGKVEEKAKEEVEKLKDKINLPF